MSTRERWIVYPLIFLSLGVSLRDKLMRTVATDRIECRELVFTQQGAKPLVGMMGEAYKSRDGVELPPGVAIFDLEQPGGEREVARVGPFVECRAVLVSDANRRPMVTLGEEQVEIENKPIHYGSINTFTGQGRPQSQLGLGLMCRELHIVDETNRRRLVSLRGVPLDAEDDESETVGRISVQGSTPEPLVTIGSSATGKSGAVGIHTSTGRPQAVLVAGESGGAVTLFQHDLQLSLSMGHFNLGGKHLSGILAQDAMGRVVPMIKPIVPGEQLPQTTPPVPGPPEPPPEADSPEPSPGEKSDNTDE